MSSSVSSREHAITRRDSCEFDVGKWIQATAGNQFSSMRNHKQPCTEPASPCDQSSLERHWGHPLSKFLAGMGFWIAHVVVAIGVVVVTWLTIFGVRIHGAWTIVAAAALIMFAYAVLFAFAGWLARSGRSCQLQNRKGEAPAEPQR